MSGGLRHDDEDERFVRVPSATIQDRTLSFKARGLLAYLIDKPPGWDVRSESIARESDRDGREAVQSGLRELGARGHYRIERRRGRDGRFSMGTAIRRRPNAEWAAEWAANDGKPISVVEQPDGTYARVSAGHTANGFPGPGETAAGPPVPGSSGAGEPRAIDIQNTHDSHPNSVVPPSAPQQPPLLAATAPATPENNPTDGRPRTAKRGTRVPDDFTVTDALRAWAADNAPSVDLDTETVKFLDHHRFKGTIGKDWNAGWRTWIKNCHDWAQSRARQQQRSAPVTPRDAMVEQWSADLRDMQAIDVHQSHLPEIGA